MDGIYFRFLSEKYLINGRGDVLISRDSVFIIKNNGL